MFEGRNCNLLGIFFAFVPSFVRKGSFYKVCAYPESGFASNMASFYTADCHTTELRRSRECPNLLRLNK